MDFQGSLWEITQQGLDYIKQITTSFYEFKTSQDIIDHFNLNELNVVFGEEINIESEFFKNMYVFKGTIDDFKYLFKIYGIKIDIIDGGEIVSQEDLKDDYRYDYIAGRYDETDAVYLDAFYIGDSLEACDYIVIFYVDDIDADTFIKSKKILKKISQYRSYVCSSLKHIIMSFSFEDKAKVKSKDKFNFYLDINIEDKTKTKSNDIVELTQYRDIDLHYDNASLIYEEDGVLDEITGQIIDPEYDQDNYQYDVSYTF